MRLRPPAVPPALVALASAYANILFSTDARLGGALVAVTMLRPVSGVGGALAVLAANATAGLLGYRPEVVRSGFYGFNALMLGLSLTVGHGLDARTLAVCVLGGAASVALTAVLGEALYRGLGLPVLVLPFLTLATVLTPAVRGAASPSTLRDFSLLGADLVLPAPVSLALEALGSLFFQHSVTAGLLVLAVSLAVSRIGTLAVLAGVAVALPVCALVTPHAGAAPTVAAAYNAALTALAVGTFFFVPSRASLVAALVASAVAALLAVSLHPLLLAAGLPLLAWPFALVTLVTVRALRLESHDRAPWAPPLPGQSPEANLEHVATFERRFGVPGPPQLFLPVSGTWRISQGADGEHTHKGPYRGALDFEIVDEQGFPFRGDGLRSEDYLCFGAPVYAPATGTVVAVYNGAADGRPGEFDTARPWGNAVVVRHGPELHSVVAHLKNGSILVWPGQDVHAGQQVGACGSSGRSPRPHLHLQAQRTPELGAHPLAFRLHHYVVEGANLPPRYVFAGLPEEGVRVSSIVGHPVVDAFSALLPGTELSLRASDGRHLRFRSEVSLLGERSLVDADRGDRLYFHHTFGCLSFTTYRGRPDGPLRALFLALPRLPSVIGAVVEYADEPPPALLLSRLARWAQELVRAVADPVRTAASLTLRTTPEGISVESEIRAGLARPLPVRYRSRVEIDGNGLARLVVTDLASPGMPLLSAEREPPCALEPPLLRVDRVDPLLSAESEPACAP